MSIRQAALAIHALSDTDRQWMLSRLSPSHRDALDPLLTELRELGIPREATVVSQVQAPARKARQSMPPAALDDVDRIDQLPAVAVLSALEGESSELVARLLACRAWPWASEVAAAYSLPVPGLVVKAPRLLEMLSRGIAQRLPDEGQAKAIVSEPRMLPMAHPRGARRFPKALYERWVGSKS